MKKRTILISLVAAILCIGILLYETGYLLPGWVNWEEKELTLSSNPMFLQGKVTLKNKTVIYTNEEGNTYSMPKKYRISDLLLMDIDRDGMPEVLMLCWAKGAYGEHHPFFAAPQSLHYTERFYIFDLEEDGLSPQWMSSKLPVKIKDMREGEDGEVIFTEANGTETIWFWDHWGMTRKE